MNVHIDLPSALQYTRIYHMAQVKAIKTRNNSRTLHKIQIAVEIQSYIMNNNLNDLPDFNNEDIMTHTGEALPVAVLRKFIQLFNHLTAVSISTILDQIYNLFKVMLKHKEFYYTAKQTCELQLDSLLYNSETRQSVYLYVCTRHVLNRPAVIQHNLRMEENLFLQNQTNKPILPSAPQLSFGDQGGDKQFQEGAHQFQEGTQEFQEGAHQFQDILDIPPAERNAFETKAVVRHLSTKRASAAQPGL